MNRRIFSMMFLFLVGISLAIPVQAENQDLKDWADRVSKAWLKSSDKKIKPEAISKETKMVAMRDGTRLSTDIYQPLIPFIKYPCVLIRTPYNKNNLNLIGTALAGLGFVCAVQDSRGCFDSEGDCWAFLDDGWGLVPERDNQDGYDTIEWITKQSWCDGNVGLFGFSALGIAANFAAGTGHPNLKCAVLIVTAADIYHEAAHQGGGFRKSLVEGWLDDIDAVTDVLNLVVEHESYDSFWQEASLINRQPQICIPIYHAGGWYDIFLQGTLDHFSGLQDHGGETAPGNQRVVIGPWTHAGQGTPIQGELSYPLNSVIETEEFERMLDWYTHWLKDDDNNIMDLSPVRYYVMGDVDEDGDDWNEWREASSWPISCTPTALYFTSEGGLYGVTPQLCVTPDTYVYNPDDPVPTRGGNNLKIDAGPYDQKSLENRSDVLVYTSALLTEPLEVIGRLKISLYASSSAPDTDWTAKLCDVYPDGRSMLVADGILRAKFRNGFESVNLMEPGQIYEFEIDLWSTAIVFNSGHRIRIDLSSSNNPRFDPNPNTGDPLRQNNEIQSATNTIYHDPEHPSCLLLPVTSPSDHPVFNTTEPSGPHMSLY